MAEKNGARDRLSIDVLPKEHRQIKVYAALHGETIREYVIESVRTRLSHEKEETELAAMAMHLKQDPVLKELWNDKKDSDYDKL
ncbi:MAG: hypothetical protein ABH843_04305 [Candidatus Omnitrophota bacterium]